MPLEPDSAKCVAGLSLLPLTATDTQLVADWLARPDTHKWLDFGAGVRSISPASLRMMEQREIHVLRLVVASGANPIGLVALSDVDREVGTARLWYLLGDRSHAGRGYTTRAVAALLKIGFDDLGLRAVNAWAVESNVPSIRVLERNGFNPAGRLRRSHLIDGETYDRLLYDLLAEEFRSHGRV